MIQVAKETNLDKTIFISDDEPDYKLIGLFFGMAQKKYYCSNESSSQYLKMANGDNISGMFPRFEKADFIASSSKRRNFEIRRNSFQENFNSALLAKYDIRSKHSDNGDISYSITANLKNPARLLNFLGKGKFDSIVNPVIKAHMDLDVFQQNITKDTIMDEKEKEIIKSESEILSESILKFRFFEENINNLIQLCLFPQISNYQNSQLLNLNIRSVSKLKKIFPIINSIEIPAKESKKKFIELCNIFKQNKIVDKVQINNFLFTKNRDITDSLEIRIIGIPIILEQSFERFLYIDHPGINLVTNIFERLKLFDTLESKLFKEILVKI